MGVQWRKVGAAFSTEIWPVWFCAIGLLTSCVLSYLLSGDLATQFRYAGVFLEVFGFALVAFGIGKTRKQFGHPGLWRDIISWFKSVALAVHSPEPIDLKIASANMQHTVPSIQWRSEGIVGPPGLEHRVKVVEQELEHLTAETRESVRRLESDLANVVESLFLERDLRQSEHDRVASRLEQFAVGGLRYEIVGLVWLFLGTIASNLPEECARIFGPWASLLSFVVTIVLVVIP